MTNQLVPAATSVPLIFTARPESCTRMSEFFNSHIRNPNTRRAYMEAVRQFSAFCAELGILDLAEIKPIHVAAFVEAQLKLHSKPTVKQRLAALRMLFDRMVVARSCLSTQLMLCAGRSTRKDAARRGIAGR